MTFKTFILFTIPFFLLLGISTHGTDCQTSTDCLPREICNGSICQCSDGHVKYKDDCFPVKAYGEECFYDIQCSEPLKCVNDGYESFCSCDWYFIWNSTVKECLELGNRTQMTGLFREVHKVGDMIERSAQKVFLGVIIAGLIFVCVLLSFIGICSFYGCCTKHKKGRYGEDDLNKGQVNEVAIIGLPGSYEAIDTDFSMAI